MVTQVELSEEIQKLNALYKQRERLRSDIKAQQVRVQYMKKLGVDFTPEIKNNVVDDRPPFLRSKPEAPPVEDGSYEHWPDPEKD